MAEKYEQQQAQGHPLTLSTMPRSDQEYNATTTNYQSHDQMKREKRIKYFAYIACLAMFQTIIILVFVLVAVRVRTPKVLMEDVVLTNTVGVDDSVRLTARVSIRNRNFGRYEFDSSLAAIRSGSVVVGRFVIHDGRAKARSTRRIFVFTDLSELGSKSSVLDLNVEARLRGEVRYLWMIRRNRSTTLNCTMSVDLSTNAVRNLMC